ncbi:MAG: hypothetical protein HY443_00225 [Candidatus Nealsonbacteria bacterium]|nr:hypothetical protein [Candidatus Nealsonbacteria bacterium]
MAKQYSPEKLAELFEKLPEELRETIFSVETAEAIRNACETYGIEDERVGKIGELAGKVLMGLLLPEEFPEKLESEVGLPKVLSQVIGREINRFVFYPVKPALEQLNKIEIAESTAEGRGKVALKEEKEKPLTPPAPAGEDRYREEVD